MKNGTGQPTIKWKGSLQRECTALNWAKVLKRRFLIQNYCVKILGLLQFSEIFMSRKNSWQKSTLKVLFYNKWKIFYNKWKFKMPFLLDSSWTTPSKCPITSLFICLPLTACCNKKSPLDKRKLQNFIPTVTSQPLPITFPLSWLKHSAQNLGVKIQFTELQQGEVSLRFSELHRRKWEESFYIYRHPCNLLLSGNKTAPHSY